MDTEQILDPPVPHRSFSSMMTWTRCGKQWQLERLYHAPSEPAWWFVGGKAFHTAAEKFLKLQGEDRVRY